MQTLDGYLSTAQAAKLTGLSVDRIRQLCRAGSVAYIQTAIGRLIEQESLLKERREAATKKGNK